MQKGLYQRYKLALCLRVYVYVCSSTNYPSLYVQVQQRWSPVDCWYDSGGHSALLLPFCCRHCWRYSPRGPTVSIQMHTYYFHKGKNLVDTLEVQRLKKNLQQFSYHYCLRPHQFNFLLPNHCIETKLYKYTYM